MKTLNFIFCLSFIASVGFAAPTSTPPNFQEVYQLLQSNLDGVTPLDLDRAAVNGLLNQLPGQVKLVEAQSNNLAEATNSGVSKTALYDDSYAYLRIGQVEGHLADKLRAAYDNLASKQKIKGVILDLRFASGIDYAAAAAAADCFLNSGQELLDWGSGSASATKKSNAIPGPMAILVNAQTSGAAEALAAALREADTGLIIGATTAGQADIFKEFTLRNGDKLRIATTPVKLGDGTALSHGVQPDIAVEEDLADEKAYLDDPYKVLHPAVAVKGQTAANQDAQRPTNEAELVKERKEGQNSDDDSGSLLEQLNVPPVPLPPVIEDATLARALDLLKGLAVLQQSHPG